MIIFSYLCTVIRTFLIIVGLLALAVVGLCIRLLVRHDRFSAHDVGADPAMRQRGIHCTTSQDREARRPRPHRIDVKRLSLFLIPCSFLLFASSCSLQYRIKKADRQFEIGEYYAAGESYKRVYSRISPQKDRTTKARVAFRMGECQRILNSSSRAAQYYQNAIRYKYPAQDSIVFLRQGEVLQAQAKYKDAEKSYQLYLEAHPDSRQAMAGVYACRQVGEWKKTPVRYKIALDKSLNAKRSSSFAPMYVGNNTDAIYFTSNRQQQASKSGSGRKKLTRTSPVTGAMSFNLYATKRDAAGKWTEIELPDGLYGESEGGDEEKSDSTSTKQTGTRELGACCFTSDGRTIYFTFSCPVNGQDLGAQIYSATRASGEWGEAQAVKLFADSTITCGHPALCPTGDTLYFSSDAPGGYGGKDIWRSVLEGDTWMMPENLGPEVNTTGDEMFPYVHANGRLYFASNGLPGYGGLDLFYMERDSSVYNMGYPFNSNGDDFGITFAGNTENGYFSSTRGQKKGIDQIYSFVLPEMEFFVTGTITDDGGNPLSDALLRLVGNDGTNTKTNVKKDGSYKIRLRKDARYTMLATARGHLNATTRFTTQNLTDSRTYTEDFRLVPLSRPVQMENIFYDFGSHTLTPQSEPGLQALVKLLRDNPNITIELAAHTDMVGDSVYNERLSQRRAQSVVDYLTAHGVERDRLTPVGYGESKPVVADKALSKKYRWMPEGQVLDETFILTLKAENQEICNTLNRRTEFRVLKTTYNLY